MHAATGDAEIRRTPPALPDFIRYSIVGLISRRSDVVSIAARHRAKFEGWLKFELAAAFASQSEVRHVEPEKRYPGDNHRLLCDLFIETTGADYYIELKTCNTSWRIEGVLSKTRPITNNVSSIVTDIMKLRERCQTAHGLACFVFFPVSTKMWDNPGMKRGLDYHLVRIESEAKLPTGSLRKSGEFVPIDTGFGMAVFVVEAV